MRERSSKFLLMLSEDLAESVNGSYNTTSCPPILLLQRPFPGEYSPWLHQDGQSITRPTIVYGVAVFSQLVEYMRDSSDIFAVRGTVHEVCDRPNRALLSGTTNPSRPGIRLR